MLVLSRKKGQSLNIGDNVRIVILDVTGDTVRIGIEAPTNISIHRSEIYQAIQEENKAAMASRDMVNKLTELVSKNVVTTQLRKLVLLNGSLIDK